MPMDIYSTAAQLKALELMPREYSFLFDTFCTDMGAVEDDAAIYDFRKGSRRMAPFVVPNVGGVLMERDGFETRKIEFPTIAPERLIAMPDITTRYFGEQIMGGMTPAERAKKMQAKDLVEMRAAIQRRKEWMARQVVLTGKLSIFRYTNEGRDLNTTQVADYGFTNFFTPATAWDQVGATIDADMHSIYDLVYDGLGQIDVMVMAPDVADALLNNSNYIKFFDGRNIDMGEINTKYKGQGVRFIGWNSDGVEMYSFSGKYTDDDGIVKPILPSGTLICGYRGMLKCPFGPVTIVEGVGNAANYVTYIKKEVPQRITGEESNTIKNRLTSRPTIVPFNVDGWCVANVLS